MTFTQPYWVFCTGTSFASDIIYSIYRLKGMLPPDHKGSYNPFDLTPAIPIPGMRRPKPGESK